MSNAVSTMNARIRHAALAFLGSLVLAVMSHFILQSYEAHFRGQPIIRLTEFVLCQLPYIIASLSGFSFASSFFAHERCCGDRVKMLLNVIIIMVIIIMGYGLYLIGVLLPFVDYSICI